MITFEDMPVTTSPAIPNYPPPIPPLSDISTPIATPLPFFASISVKTALSTERNRVDPTMSNALVTYGVLPTPPTPHYSTSTDPYYGGISLSLFLSNRNDICRFHNECKCTNKYRYLII